ncbi:MAG TPA: DNA-processing protein DprA [Candidatus Paceibacterota bacterium]|nr:DNA-processing protein DprA [Candidatus Paceibacterota bacterium]
MNSINDETYPLRRLDPEEYPRLVVEAGSPPKELYIRGRFPPREYKFLTVVGSRKLSPYGELACKRLIAGLRGYPVVIVSGLAYGVDSVAHAAALDAGLMTVAIPGSGLLENVIYPREHLPLACKILESGGCLLSPFAGAISSKHWTFAARNRLMAAVSHATLVIEAGRPSGTLITSKWATDLDRDVMAVPGRIFDAHSEGPHHLIRMGAVPVVCAADILEVLGYSPSDDRPATEYSRLGEDERAVIRALESPMPRQRLLETLGMETAAASALISGLELKGVIEERMGELRRV